MKTPTVSIIIPVHNRADLIKRSINSILSQTNQDYEIIIIDDASTDNLKDTLDQYNNDQIVYIRLDENKGQCIARNTGINKANGKYIGFLDSDDEWLPEKIKKQLTLFEQSNDPELAAVYCGFIEKDEIKNKSFVINRDNLRGNIYKELLSGFCPSTPTMFLVKKDVIDEVNGFDETLTTFVDYDLWLRIAKLGYKFDYIDEPLIVKHEHFGPQIAKNIEKRLMGLNTILEKWGVEIIDKAGVVAYNRFKKNQIESLVKSVLNNPGKNYKVDIKKSLKLLAEIRSKKIKLYIKGLLILYNVLPLNHRT